MNTYMFDVSVENQMVFRAS